MAGKGAGQNWEGGGITEMKGEKGILKSEELGREGEKEGRNE